MYEYIWTVVVAQGHEMVSAAKADGMCCRRAAVNPARELAALVYRVPDASLIPRIGAARRYRLKDQHLRWIGFGYGVTGDGWRLVRVAAGDSR